jgi:hypothetical protein
MYIINKMGVYTKDNFGKCEFCGFEFYKGTRSDKEMEIDKYNHLSGHGDFLDKLNIILNNFPSLKKYVKINNKKSFNEDRNTHQFYAVLYNYENNGQYYNKLKDIDNWLEIYGNKIESKYKNMINRKISYDLFSFYSEMRFFNAIKMLEIELEILDDNDIDFLIPSLNLGFEVKTPINSSKKNLKEFVCDIEVQKQIKKRKKNNPNEIIVLCIDTMYFLLDFPIKTGDWLDRKIIDSYDNINWDVCITFDSLHGKQDLQINPNSSLSENQEEFLNKIRNKLIE